MSHEDCIVGIVALNGGRLVGKTRLQKTVYLLEKRGMSVGFDFEYHNFGPFSVDVARATDFAKAEGRLDERPQQGFHGVPYSLFETPERAPDRLGKLSAGEASELLQIMGGYSAIELELAATMAFLADEGESDVDSALIQLKPAKATEERIARAHNLLDELGCM